MTGRQRTSRGERRRRALSEHNVHIPSDSDWQSDLRLLQALWREDHGWPIGSYVPARGPRQGEPVALGNLLEMPAAETEGWNLLTPVVSARVAKELASSDQAKLIARPRIFNNLLASQPMAFNLFAELDHDRDLATRALRRVWPDQLQNAAVTSIEFEWSPGRQDPRYLNNGSAFDVIVNSEDGEGVQGFIGIEVKYHESLKVTAASMKRRYREVSEESGAFKDPKDRSLAKQPLQQVWLDHLLALSMTLRDDIRGTFVLLHPDANRACQQVGKEYESKLLVGGSFRRTTVESVVAALEEETDADWVADFRDRYLAMDRVDFVAT